MICRALISGRMIDNIFQWFRGAEVSQILREQLSDLIPMTRAEAGRVWREDHVRRRPEWIVRLERLSLEDVEDCSTELA